MQARTAALTGAVLESGPSQAKAVSDNATNVMETLLRTKLQ